MLSFISTKVAVVKSSTSASVVNTLAVMDGKIRKMQEITATTWKTLEKLRKKG